MIAQGVGGGTQPGPDPHTTDSRVEGGLRETAASSAMLASAKMAPLSPVVVVAAAAARATDSQTAVVTRPQRLAGSMLAGTSSLGGVASGLWLEALSAPAVGGGGVS